jgi:GxxExxY protein
MDEAALNTLSRQVLDAAFAVHTALGPGLLEAAYEACLLAELRARGLYVEVEVPVPVVYRGEKLADVGYRIDLLVERELVIEIKALETIAPVHKAQLLSYLRLSGRRLGLLINFNVESLRDGIVRKINGY